MLRRSRWVAAWISRARKIRRISGSMGGSEEEVAESWSALYSSIASTPAKICTAAPSRFPWNVSKQANSKQASSFVLIFVRPSKVDCLTPTIDMLYSRYANSRRFCSKRGLAFFHPAFKLSAPSAVTACRMQESASLAWRTILLQRSDSRQPVSWAAVSSQYRWK